MTLITNKAHLFNLIDPYLPDHPHIVEAGAFTGTDTLSMAHRWPQAIIHAFEPVPEIYQQLKNNTVSYPTIQCYQTGLSSYTGTASFNCAFNPKKPHIPCQAGSLLLPAERLNWSPIVYPEVITVPVTTLDAWALQYHVDAIDGMWLDVQGHELAILQASPTIVSALKVLYLEVHFIPAYKHQASFEETMSWLTTQGFVEIGRDFTNQTDWFFGNVLVARP
jgi:FkbM family methyltransferase